MKARRDAPGRTASRCPCPTPHPSTARLPAPALPEPVPFPHRRINYPRPARFGCSTGSVFLFPGPNGAAKEARQRSPNGSARPAAAGPSGPPAEQNGNGIIFLRGVRSDNGRIILTRDDTIRLQDGVLSLANKDRQRPDNEQDSKRPQNQPLLLYATSADVTNGNVLVRALDDAHDQLETVEQKDEKPSSLPVGSGKFVFTITSNFSYVRLFMRSRMVQSSENTNRSGTKVLGLCPADNGPARGRSRRAANRQTTPRRSINANSPRRAMKSRRK